MKSIFRKMKLGIIFFALADAKMQFKRISQERVDFFTAKKKCEEIGGTLPYFNNRAEWDQYLKEIPTNEKSWLGIIRDNLSSSTGWQTVSLKDKRVLFTHWGAREPNGEGRGENCVEFSNWSKDWNDQECSDKIKFSCRIEDEVTWLLKYAARYDN